MSDTMTHSTNGDHEQAADTRPAKGKLTKEQRDAVRLIKEAEQAAKAAAKRAMLPETKCNLDDATTALEDAEDEQATLVAAELGTHRAYLAAKAKRVEKDADVIAKEAAKTTARKAHNDWLLKQATAKDDQ